MRKWFHCKCLTPLLGLAKMAQLLLVHHAEMEFTDKEGNTALHVACQDDAIEVCRLLVEHGADISRQNKEKKTPLNYLSQSNRSLLLRLHQRRVIPT